MSSVDGISVAALETRLREKEQLVGVLTQRLEQAAEQLDRVRRTGGDRRRSGGGVPAEFVESQQQMMEEIGLAVERMEAAQAAETLGRIEAQVHEIRTLLLEDGPPVARVSGPPAAKSAGGAAKPVAGNGKPGSRNEPPPATDAESAWAALKARMLANDPNQAGRADQQQPVTQESPAAADNPPATPPAERAPEPEPEPEPPADPPIAIDVDTADREDLAAAVVARDDYIGYLLRRLRVRESRAFRPVDFESIGAPEELRERLEELEGRLQETLRRAEIELSLERARLGRVEAELEQRSERLEKELRRLGVHDEHETAEEHAERGPRWMRMLGLGKQDER